MKRIVIALALLVTVLSDARSDRKVAYFDDMANPIDIYIKPESWVGKSNPDGTPQLITVHVEPQKFAQVTIPGGKIAELTIVERLPNGKQNSEKLYARKSSLGENPAKFGHDATLNNDERYVIVHNRINPLRVFRLLNPRDKEIKDAIQAAASKAGSAAATAGGVALDVGVGVGKVALWFLTVGTLAP